MPLTYLVSRGNEYVEFTSASIRWLNVCIDKIVFIGRRKVKNKTGDTWYFTD